MKEKINKIIACIIFFSVTSAIVSIFIFIFDGNGKCINSNTIENIYYYKEQSQIINENMPNKIYKNKNEIILEIKKIANKKFYNKYIYILKNSYELLQEFNNTTYKLEDKGFKFKKIYIPTDEDLKKIKYHKNELYDNFEDFMIMLESLNINNEFVTIVGYNTGYSSDMNIRAGYFSILFSVISIIFVLIYLRILDKEKEEERERTKIEIKQEEKNNQDKIKPVLDYAKIELQGQMNIIKKQSKNIFFTSIFFSITGIIIIIYILFFKKDNSIKVSIITACGGIIGEVIGGIFLVMYKSLLNQLNENLKILERLNIIGISTKILDTIETNNKEEINKMKIELSKKIIEKVHY